MEKINVKIINQSPFELPNYETPGAAGMDLRAHIAEKITIKPMERCLVKTGLFLEIPIGYEAQVRPRSGLALKKGITVLNSPGTIDTDYRGEVGVILVNLSNENFEIHPGDRIAQLVFAAHATAQLEPVISLENTERGTGGFGSTGAK